MGPAEIMQSGTRLLRRLGSKLKSIPIAMRVLYRLHRKNFGTESVQVTPLLEFGVPNDRTENEWIQIIDKDEPRIRLAANEPPILFALLRQARTKDTSVGHTFESGKMCRIYRKGDDVMLGICGWAWDAWAAIPDGQLEQAIAQCERLREAQGRTPPTSKL